MVRTAALLLMSILVAAPPAFGAAPPEPEPSVGEKLAHGLATYIPNRILDLAGDDH